MNNLYKKNSCATNNSQMYKIITLATLLTIQMANGMHSGALDQFNEYYDQREQYHLQILKSLSEAPPWMPGRIIKKIKWADEETQSINKELFWRNGKLIEKLPGWKECPTIDFKASLAEKAAAKLIPYIRKLCHIKKKQTRHKKLKKFADQLPDGCLKFIGKAFFLANYWVKCRCGQPCLPGITNRWENPANCFTHHLTEKQKEQFNDWHISENERWENHLDSLPVFFLSRVQIENGNNAYRIMLQ